MHGATVKHHVSSKDVTSDLICATAFCAWFPFILAIDFAAYVKKFRIQFGPTYCIERIWVRADFQEYECSASKNAWIRR